MEFLTNLFTKDNIAIFIVCAIIIWIFLTLFKIIKFIVCKVAKFLFKILLIALVFGIIYGINKNIPDLLMNFLLCLTFIGSLYRLEGKKINLPKEQRNAHFLMPFFALLYSLIVISCSGKINSLLTKFLNWLVSFIPEAILKLATLITIKPPVISEINFGKYYYYAYCICIVIGFIIIKKVIFMNVLPWCYKMYKKIKIKDNNNLHFILKNIYYNEKEESPILEKKYENSEFLLQWIYYGAWAFAGITMIIAQYWSANKLIPTAYYPVFALLVLGEIYYFFCGNRKEVKPEEPVKQPIRPFHEKDIFLKMFHYIKMYKYLKKNYDEKILNSYTLESNSDSKESEIKGTDPVDIYFENLRKDGKKVEKTLVDNVKIMLEGKSVLISTPFYKDLTPYLIIPIIRQLMSYKKVLILVGREKISDGLKDWIRDGIAEHYGREDFKNLWKIENISDDAKICDIGILCITDLFKTNLLNDDNKFLNEVGFVILLEPSAMISSGHFGLHFLVERIRQANNNVAYCAINKKSSGLHSRLSEILGLRNLHENSSLINSSLINCFIFNWASEINTLKSLTEGLKESTYKYPDGLVLSLIGLKQKVPNKAIWASKNRYPVEYWKDANQSKIVEFLKDRDTNDLEVTDDYWSQSSTNAAFITVEDEFYNMFEIASLFSTRAQKTCFINIMSDSYLLRNYMIDNFKVFKNNPNGIPNIIPKFTKNSERNKIIFLVLKMFHLGICETKLFEAIDKLTCDLPKNSDEIKKSLPKYVENKDIFVKFEALIKKYCNINNFILKENLDISPKAIMKDNKLQDFAFFKIKPNSMLANYAKICLFTEYIFHDNSKDTINLPRHLIYQRFIPDQFISYEGKYYKINEINNEFNIKLGDDPDQINNRQYWRQTRDYMLSGNIQSKVDPNNPGVDIYTCLVENISIKTPGYIRFMNSQNDFNDSNHVPINNIPKRVYKNKEILKLEFKDISDIKILKALAVLINEIFVTIFPEHYHFISAMICCEEKEDDTNLSKILHSLKHKDKTDNSTIFIIEDSEIDLGLLDAFKDNFSTILQIIADYLDWMYHDEIETSKNCASPNNISANQSESTNVKDDVEIESEGKHIQNYLKFGLDKEPENFDFKGVFTFLNKHKYFENSFTEARKNAILISDDSMDEDYFNDKNAKYCDFCAEKITGFASNQTLSNNRNICDKCKDKSIKTEDELFNIFEATIKDALLYFGMDLDFDKISVVLSSLEKIEKLSGKKITLNNEFNDRPLAFCEKQEDGRYFIHVENSTPDYIAKGYILRELASLWERIKLEKDGEKDENVIKSLRIGKAIWTQIQYFVYTNRSGYSKRLILHTINRTDNEEIFIDYYKKYGFIDIHDMGINEYVMQIIGENLEEFGEFSLFDDSQDNPIKNNIAKTMTDTVPHKCDYCGKKINAGEEFEVLKDGLERCMDCSALSLKNKKEFVELLEEVKEKYSKHFGVKIYKPMKVFVVNAERIAKERKVEFKTTNDFDKRSQGFARHCGSKRDKHEIWLERGCPIHDIEDTIVHELTHIWQFENWDYKKNKSKYGEENERMLEEGHAMWAQLQYYLYENNKKMVDSKINQLGSFGEHNHYVSFDYHRGHLEYYHQYGYVDRHNMGIEKKIEEFNLGDIQRNKNNTPFDDKTAPIEMPIKWTKEEWEKRFEESNP